MNLHLDILFSVLRTKQWIKNLIVFAALIFSMRLFHGPSLMKACAAFVGFCLASSAAYILNDILDLKEDRKHPWKQRRPLASGALKIWHAAGLGAILALTASGSALVVRPALMAVVLAFLGLQILYSIRLKHVVLLDVLLIATGFVLRAVGGGVAIGANISNWLLLCTFLLALFLALCKRRQELVVLTTQAVSHRPVLAEYSREFVDSLLAVITGATVVSYALYSVSPEVIHKLGTDRLIFTVPFVVYGIFRYLYLIHQKELGDSPTQVLYSDRPLQAGILAWLAVCMALIYHFPV